MSWLTVARLTFRSQRVHISSRKLPKSTGTGQRPITKKLKLTVSCTKYCSKLQVPDWLDKCVQILFNNLTKFRTQTYFSLAVEVKF